MLVLALPAAASAVGGRSGTCRGRYGPGVRGRVVDVRMVDVRVNNLIVDVIN